jgi:uncharacterized repeat protein (TIGR01451 family)
MHAPLLIGLAAAAVLPGIAAAAPAGADPVKITASVQAEVRETAADGTTRVKLVPARRVVPGDHVVYAITVRNDGARPATGVVIANPVPANMRYVGPAAQSPVPEVSVDGKTFGPLATLRITTAAGPRPATAADVRVVRWRLTQPVAPGGAGQVAFRALLK